MSHGVPGTLTSKTRVLLISEKSAVTWVSACERGAESDHAGGEVYGARAGWKAREGVQEVHELAEGVRKETVQESTSTSSSTPSRPSLLAMKISVTLMSAGKAIC